MVLSFETLCFHKPQNLTLRLFKLFLFCNERAKRKKKCLHDSIDGNKIHGRQCSSKDHHFCVSKQGVDVSFTTPPLQAHSWRLGLGYSYTINHNNCHQAAVWAPELEELDEWKSWIQRSGCDYGLVKTHNGRETLNRSYTEYDISTKRLWRYASKLKRFGPIHNTGLISLCFMKSTSIVGLKRQRSMWECDRCSRRLYDTISHTNGTVNGHLKLNQQLITLLVVHQEMWQNNKWLVGQTAFIV